MNERERHLSRTCAAPGCTNSLAGKRVDAVYCSPTCRTFASDVRSGKRAYNAQESTIQMPPRLSIGVGLLIYGVILGIAAIH